MLTLWFLTAVFGIFGILLGWLPVVSISTVPGLGLLSQGVGYIFWIVQLFPPLQIMLNGFIFILYFEVIMLVIRIIFRRIEASYM